MTADPFQERPAGYRIACGHPETAQAARLVLEAGGNAFDAAVAAGFAGAVAEPALTSLGGGGFLLARTASGDTTLFDFFTDTPGRGRGAVTPHFFPQPVHFPGSTQIFNVGLGSVAVPGNLQGFLHVHKRLGRLVLARVVEPAVRLAREGVLLNRHQAYFMTILHPILSLSEAGKRLYGAAGAAPRPGDRLRNPDLAGFLAALPDDEGTSFHHGPLAAAIVADMAANGGLLTLADLADYRVIERQPLRFSYGDVTLHTNPAPSFGGPLIAATLQLLAAAGLGSHRHGSSGHLLLLARAMQEIERYRAGAGNDEPATAAWCAAAGARLRRQSSGTTHVSVRDREGNVASMTTSNGEGSGYIVPGTGIMLNNMMGEDDLHPDGFHASPPGTRISSMMAPCLAEREGEVVLVIGSGGSKRIRTAIPQVVANLLDFGMSCQQAVDAPRLHWDGETLQMEPGFDSAAVARLQTLMPVNLWSEANMYFGGVHAIAGTEAAADPRRGGAALAGD
ncbi:MAG: gamma-glutamyltransferase [Thermodesulfobacteriota bacterium]